MYTEVNRTIQTVGYMIFRLNKGQESDEQYANFIEANLVSNTGAVALEDIAVGEAPNSDHSYAQELDCDEIPHMLRTARKALDKVSPQSSRKVHNWLFSPNRTKEEMSELLISVQDIARKELDEIPDLFNEGPDRPKLTIHRYADIDGNELCAMSALSKMLGYSELTDIPSEVDPGLVALVNLLNERANNRARQLLIWRLVYLPETNRTDICSLIADVFFTEVLERNGFQSESEAMSVNKSHHTTINTFTDLGNRFLKSDGSCHLALGCLTMAAALKSNDPTTQDILAVAAASQVVSYETGEGWFELLYILDFILDLEESPSQGGLTSMGDFYEYFGDESPSSEEKEKPEDIEYF
jgi:hypothetical protein